MNLRILLFTTLLNFCSLAFAATGSQSVDCATLLRKIPNADLLSEYTVEERRKVWSWLQKLNNSMPSQLRLTSNQLDHVFAIISYDHDEEMQLRHLLSPVFADQQIIKIAPGQLGEWEEPIHSWLTLLLNKELPTREQIEENKKKYYYNTRNPLNPIQKHRYELLRKEVAQIEDELGQKIFSNADTLYYAQDESLASYFRKSAALYRGLKIPENVSILELKDKLKTLNKSLSSGDRFGGVDFLIVQLISFNSKAIFEEIEYYVDLATENKNFERSKLIHARISSWFDGRNESFQDTIKNHLANEVIKFFEIHSKGGLGPHYIGDALTYSIGQSIGNEFRTKGAQVMQNNLGSIDLDKIKVSYLGAWLTAHTPRLFGKKVGEPVAQGSYIYAVEFTDSFQHRHFAVQVSAKFTESNQDLDLLNATYKTLTKLDIREIRETLLSPRLQDGFKTSPLDLIEPLVELTEESGVSPLKTYPTQILIEHLPLTKKESERGLEDHSNLAIASAVADQLSGAPSGAYISIRLFRDHQQIVPDKLYLDLVEETPYKQVFQLNTKVSWLNDLNIKIERTVVSNTYRVTLNMSSGLGRFRMNAADWHGVFKPPKR